MCTGTLRAPVSLYTQQRSEQALAVHGTTGPLPARPGLVSDVPSTDADPLNLVFKNPTMSPVTLQPTQGSTVGHLSTRTPCSPALPTFSTEATKMSAGVYRVLIVNIISASSCIYRLLLNFMKRGSYHV